MEDYIKLIDFVRENRLIYSKLYQLTLKGILRSKRINNRIYINKTDGNMFLAFKNKKSRII